MSDALAVAADSTAPGEWLRPWQECLSARQRGMVPTDEQVFIFLGVPIRGYGDRWCVSLPADSIAFRHAPLAIVAGIDCTVYYSSDALSFGLLSGLSKRLLDCQPRRLQLIDVDQAPCIFLRLTVNNG